MMLGSWCAVWLPTALAACQAASVHWARWGVTSGTQWHQASATTFYAFCPAGVATFYVLRFAFYVLRFTFCISLVTTCMISCFCRD